MKIIDDNTIKLISKEISDVSKFLLNWDKIKSYRNSNHIGILSGLSGIILVLLECLKTNSMNNQNDILKKYIKHTFEILEKSKYLMPTYCDGLAGYGFFLLKLKSSQLIDVNDEELSNRIDDALEQIDEILQEHIKIYYENDNLDILHGLLGLGIYFIERGFNTEANMIIKILNKKAFRTEQGHVYWKKYDTYDYHTTILDMGNAHGMGANIFLLTKLLSKPSFLNEDSRVIANDLVNNSIIFFLSNAQNITKGIYCYYPSKIKDKDFQQNTLTPVNSRLGWCYGDLGILYTLLMASIQLGKKKYVKQIKEKLIFVANRRYDDEKFTVDAGICHGTSGIAILFLNIYYITNDEIFWKTANYWLKQTLNKRDNNQPNSGIVSYDFVIENSPKENISILEGLSGVLVCYLKFLFSKAPISEELLMIKY